MNHAATLIVSVGKTRTALLESLAELSETQAVFKPGEGQWSITEVVEHLYLAELSGVSKIWAALDALKAGRGWSEGLPNHGRSIDAVVASTWKPVEVAPPIATPHIGGPLSFWVAATRSLQGILEDLGTRLDGVTLEDVVFPHYLSGPLDGRQRLDFLRFHIERHMGQIERICADASFPR